MDLWKITVKPWYDANGFRQHGWMRYLNIEIVSGCMASSDKPKKRIASAGGNKADAKTKQERRRRFYARALFELRVRQAKGEAYQDLFNAVMTRRYPGFIPMEPYGNFGDRKNDGYIPELGIFFQVYAPSDPEKKLAAAARKAKEDFHGLFQKWKLQPIKEFRFAFNNEYGGSNVPLEEALASIAKKYGVKATPFLAHHLEEEAMQLPLDQLEDIVNFLIPEPDEIRDTDYAALKEVIEHVMSADAQDLAQPKLIAPKFNEKIKFNGLSANVADLLRVAGRQTDVVIDFFSRRSATHKQDLRDHLASIYDQEKRNAKRQMSKPDTVFFGILSAMIPSRSHRSRQAQDAALVVMAYYFDACDVFEEPDAAA